LQALQAPPTELKATDDRPDDPAQAHDPARPHDRGRIRRCPVELHWRLERASWGRGFATEGARACLEFAFASLELTEVLAFTVPANTRSRAVMKRLGMWHDVEGDFEHPRLPPGDPLRHHVLYRLTREHWQRGAGVGLSRH
jgi:RimJ/RimL family protein N-acetyltransferase